MTFQNILPIFFLASTSAIAEVSITVKQIDESHVLRMYEAKNYTIAREMAVQCSDKDNNANCQLHAAEFFHHGVGGSVDQVAAVKYLTKSAENDHPAAQAMLGNFYHNGIGVAKDTATAVKWWQASATNCNPWAQNAVARSYYDGELVAVDKVKALFWVSLAAQYKFPNAEKGVEVISEELTADEKSRANKMKQEFLRTTECGKGRSIQLFDPNGSD
jgi:uncharacterized protein